MNKRIEELAAKIDCMQDKYGLYHSDVWDSDGNVNGVDLEKFAELIIQECMKVAASQRNPANLNYKPSERFVEDLRQHFGVDQ